MIQLDYCQELMKKSLTGFGTRFAALRQARSLTQEELGSKVGMTQRMMAYYEQEDSQPPGALLVDLAKTLDITSDELLGIKPAKPKASPKSARLLKRLQQVEKLPQSDQRAVLKFVDALVASRRRTA